MNKSGDSTVCLKAETVDSHRTGEKFGSATYLVYDLGQVA